MTSAGRTDGMWTEEERRLSERLVAMADGRFPICGDDWLSCLSDSELRTMRADMRLALQVFVAARALEGRRGLGRFALWAHDAQWPPEGDWRCWLFMGGRGAGKTRAGAEWVRACVASGVARRVALVGPTLGDVREVMVEGPSGLRSVCDGDERPDYSVTRRRLVWPNGAEAFAFSAEDPDSLRGPQFDLAWCDEIGAWAHDEATWDMLSFALRLGDAPRVMATTTPRPRKLVKRLVALAGRGDGVVMTRAGTAENVGLSEGAVAALYDAYAGTRLARQELEGELVEDPPGALFTREVIERWRVGAGGGELGPSPGFGHLPRSEEEGCRGVFESNDSGEGLESDPLLSSPFPGEEPRGGDRSRTFPPGRGRLGGAHFVDRVEFERVVVAVDPPAGLVGDACGIVAAGLKDGVVYVIGDASVRGLAPLDWARRVVGLAREVGAGRIVAEANQGGEMVREVLRLAAGNEPVAVKLRHATRSKRDRAEPVSVMYARGEVRHAGVFRELEGEMCSFGAEGLGSPDRVDALVWAVSELTGKAGVRPRVWRL